MACAGVEPDGGPILRPLAGGVGGFVGGEDGAVELCVGELEPGGALVVEVGESAFLERDSLAAAAAMMAVWRGMIPDPFIVLPRACRWV